MSPMSLRVTRVLIYFGVVLLVVSVLGSFYDVFPYVVYTLIHTTLFFLAFWYLVWHYRITKGHLAAYDRMSEGSILLMIIYNPLKPFLLEVEVWMFLDFVFMWLFILYIITIRDIEKKLKEGRRNWGYAGDEFLT